MEPLTFVIVTITTVATIRPLPIIRKTPKLPVRLSRLQSFADHHLAILKAEYPKAVRVSISFEYIAPNGKTMRLSKRVDNQNSNCSKEWQLIQA